MATQNQEEENFIKMFRLVTGVGRESLLVEFDKQFPPASLSSTLATNEPKLINLHTVKKRLTTKQMSLLFPSSGTPTSHDFDITLMVCLIRNLTRMIPPFNGFDKLPLTSETSTGADIARLKWYRNMLAHADSNRISNPDFSAWWTDLSDAIVRLGGLHFKNECDKCKTLTSITEAEWKMLNKQVVEFKNIYNEELKELKEKTEEFQEAISNVQTEVATVTRNTEAKLHDVESEMATVSRTTEDVRVKVIDVETKIVTFSRDTEDVKNKLQDVESEMTTVSRTTEEVRQKVAEIETNISEVIPVHIQDQITKQLELWQEKDQKFVATRASDHVLESITKNNCITVTGNPGIGKTFIVRRVALIMQSEGYTIIPTCIPKDIRDFTKPGRRTLFIIDDIGGHYTLNQTYLDDWKPMLSDIKLLLTNNHCKIIATCRSQVFKDEKFKSLSIFNLNECNLSSEKLCLTSKEKSQIAKKYFGDQASKISQLSDQYEIFPLLCSLYDKDKFSDISLFFSKPFECYKEELDHLLIDSDESRYKYCVLALVVMFNNKLSEEHFSDDYNKVIENTLDKCKLNKGTSMECLKDALHTLEGTFIVKDGNCYKTVHDKIFDFFSFYFGDKMLQCIIDNATSEFINERILWNSTDNTESNIEFTINLPDKYLDMFISRLVNDWSDGKVCELFCSRNLESPTFIVKLLDNIKQHDKSFQVKLVNVTVDNKYHNTTLLQSCFVGDVNLTQWILDNTYYNSRCSVLCKSVLCCNNLSQWFYRNSIVNKCNNNGVSPVYTACQKGHVNILNTLIQCKADINKCTNGGRSPVYIACYNGHVNILNTLIQCKADIDKCTNDGVSPVYIACQKGHVNILNTLIQCKADMNKCTNDGRSPVYTACYNGHVNILNTLIQCKADINKCTNDGRSPVYTACFNGHVNILNTLIQCKADINKCMNDGVSPFYIACQKGHVNILNTLIQCKADINKCTNDGRSPVYTACYNGHVNILNTLIQCKADINKCTNDGASPVYIACQNGHVNILNTLIQCKADINKCTNDGASPVYIACQNGHVNILNTLIQCKADINKCMNDGRSPVYTTCYNGHVNILNTLIQCKADINKCNNNGSSPVYIACQEGHVNVLNTLIQCKADIDKCTNDGVSPVYIACQKGHVNILNTLIQCKADINKCANDGASPVYIACYIGHVNILNTLIQCKADINKCMIGGSSPVHTACYNGHVNILNTLIQCKADINKCTDAGSSPLHIACYKNHIDVVIVLLKLYKENNVKIDVCNDLGNTPLYCACNKGNVQIVKLLLQHGANPHQCNNKGQSPLHVTCNYNHIDVVIVLLKLYKENNVKIDLCDDWGHTPLYYACNKGYVQIVKLLLQHGANPHQCNNKGKSPLQEADDKGHVDVVTAIKQFKPV